MPKAETAVTWKGWEDYVPPITNAPQPPPVSRCESDPLAPPKKRGKYGAVKTTVDGITFDSKKEAARYQELKALQAAGEIRSLELQPQYPLVVSTPNGATVVIGRYIPDFRYVRNGETVIEDAKGMKTEIYRLKKKLVEAQYGIQIRET